MPSSIRIAVRVILLAWAVLLAGASAAQTTSASLAGTLRTDKGRAAGGAVIHVRSVGTGAVRTVVTDDQGRYRIDSLSPGEWTVSARLADGQVSKSQVVQLRLQQTVQLDFKIDGGVAEKITVTAEAPLVDRKETAGKMSLSGEQANGLPISGRAFTDLALLDSSVRKAAPGNFFGERGSVFVVNGQSGRSNSFLVDGLDNNDQASGTTSNSFFSQLVIQEFVLLTHQFSPEFGRASGGVLNVVTRRGSNEPSLEAFIQGSASGWNEAGPFVDNLSDAGSSRDTPRHYQTGFSVGGPFRKDRAFYFFAYEHQEADEIIPYTGVDRDGNAGGRFDAPSKDDNFFFRTDFNIGSENTLMFRLSVDDRKTSGVNVGGVFTPEAGFRIDERDMAVAASWTSVVSPRVVNELRFLAASSSFDQFANSSLPGVSRPSGIFGGNSLNLQLRNEDRFQLVENISFQHHDHTFKLGLDLTRSRTRIKTAFNPNGNYQYDTDLPFEPGDCGDIFIFLVQQARNNGTWPIVPCPGTVGVDDDGDSVIDEPANILTYPSVFTYISGQPEALLTDNKLALFAQDEWKVGSRLVLDYGLRYDLSTYRLPDSARVESSVPNGGANRDYDNLAPRLGFTVTPKDGGKLVIRGGGGVFYDKIVLGFPAVTSITSGTEIGFSFPQGLAGELTEALPTKFVLQNSFFPETLAMRFSTATQLETPYTVHFNLGLERPLTPFSALRVDAVSARGYHLPLMLDLNPVIGVEFPNTGQCPNDPQPFGNLGVPCHVADQQVGSISSLASIGRSWYTGLNANWRWQRDGSWIATSYTWSKAEDMGFDPLKGGISLPPDSRDLSAERGRSDGDRRHRLVLSGETGLPWAGLRASAVVQWSSGLTFNVTTGQDNNLDGILSDRPAGIGRNTGEDTPLDPINAYRLEFGKVYGVDLEPVAELNEPSFAQVDLRLFRPFGFGHGKGSGSVFLQVINLLDRENAGLVEGRVTSPNFGRTVTLAGPARIVELGMKFGY